MYLVVHLEHIDAADSTVPPGGLVSHSPEPRFRGVPTEEAPLDPVLVAVPPRVYQPDQGVVFRRLRCHRCCCCRRGGGGAVGDGGGSRRPPSHRGGDCSARGPRRRPCRCTPGGRRQRRRPQIWEHVNHQQCEEMKPRIFACCSTDTFGAPRGQGVWVVSVVRLDRRGAILGRPQLPIKQTLGGKTRADFKHTWKRIAEACTGLTFLG